MMHRFHRYVLGHKQDWVRVSVGLFHMWSKGYLVECECGKRWAL